MEKEIVLTKKMLQMEFEKAKKLIKLVENAPFLSHTCDFAVAEKGKDFDTNVKNMYWWLSKKLEEYKDVDDENEVVKRIIKSENEVNVIKMGTFDKFIAENRLWGCGFDYDESTGNYVLCDKRLSRFKPYLAVCEGWRKEDRRYLPTFGGWHPNGEFYVEKAKYGNILFGGFFDKQKCQFVRERYYVVLSNNKKDGLTVADGSWRTYFDAYGYMYTLKYNKRNNK